MKKLLITSTELMMIQFLVPHVKYLSENGFRVEIACSEVGGRMEDVRNALEGVVDAIHVLRLERSPVNPRNFLGYQDLRKLLHENHYDVIWTNEPVMGVVTRLAANKYRRKGTKVVYMCHGFHFYKGASLPNWLIFYPVERFMSRFCDMIVTINHEDEARAKTFHSPRVEYIHGIGVNTDRLHNRNEQSDIRAELGLTNEDFLVLSVGELNENKNQQVIIRAVAQLKDPKIHYLLCGKGDQREKLESLAKELGIAEHVHFLGYRKDVVDICYQCDVFAHPSRREGLGLAPLEAMYCGLPLVTSNVQGIPDYVENGVTGFMCDPTDVDGFAEHLQLLIRDKNLRERMVQTNLQQSDRYSVANIQPIIAVIMDCETQEVYGHAAES